MILVVFKRWVSGSKDMKDFRNLPIKRAADKMKKREDDRNKITFDHHSVFQRLSNDYNIKLFRRLQFDGCVKRFYIFFIKVK